MALEENRDDILLDGILDSLEDMGHSGSLMQDGVLKSAVESGVDSIAYTDLLTALCSELKSSTSLQESVTRPQGPGDAESFQLELRSFVTELQCPHLSLTMDMQVLASYEKRLLLLDYLVSEVLAARLTALQQQKQDTMEVNGEECNSISSNFTAILKTYGFNKPPPSVTIRLLYERIIGKTRAVLEKCPPQYLGKGLVTQTLSAEQWEVLDKINQSLTEEYAVRRQMLLTRCDVTVQSFGWSDKLKGSSEDTMAKIYQERRQELSSVAPVTVAHVLAAKEDLLSIKKTNDQSVRGHTQCSINKVLIGRVPDRGGRPRETRPPPEMPTFKKRTEAPQGQRTRGGGGGGRGKGKGGGGRVQGGWSGGHGGGGAKGGGWGHQGSQDGYKGHQGGGKSRQYYS